MLDEPEGQDHVLVADLPQVLTDSAQGGREVLPRRSRMDGGHAQAPSALPASVQISMANEHLLRRYTWLRPSRARMKPRVGPTFAGSRARTPSWKVSERIERAGLEGARHQVHALAEGVLDVLVLEHLVHPHHQHAAGDLLGGAASCAEDDRAGDSS